MSYKWKTLEARTNKLEMKLNELESSGFEIIKVDLMNWEPSLQSGLYLILARQPIQAASIPGVKFHIPLVPSSVE
jgi:hypothetical protein